MKLHRRIAKVFGYELIKAKKNPSTNSHVINLINHYRIDLVIDVGANNGQFGRMIRNEGYKGEIHSFEPVNNTFEELSKSCINDSQWFAYKIALSDSCGEEEVNVMESSDLSSFLTANDFGKSKYEKIKVSYTETVEVSTLDIFLKTQIPNIKERRVFLKMDTQGYDIKVFKGAVASLSNIYCILSEISLISIYSGMPNYLDALKTYESSGFIVTGLYPISRKKDLSIIEMDCMLINGRLRKGERC